MQHLSTSHNRIAPPSANNLSAPTDSTVQPGISCPWHAALASPPAEHIKDTSNEREVTEDDLNAVRDMVERFNVRWRYFLVQPGLMQIMVPEIADKVQQVSRYLDDTTSRFESTRKFLKTVILEGPDSEQGHEIVARINAVHKHIGIDPDSPAFTFVLYTLSTQFINSIRMNSRIAPTEREEEALFKVLRRVGVKMGAHNIPENYSEFVRYNQKFLQHIEAGENETSRAVARQLLEKGVTPLPLWYRPFARTLALSFVEPKILRHLGIKPPPLAVSTCVRGLCQMVTSQGMRI